MDAINESNGQNRKNLIKPFRKYALSKNVSKNFKVESKFVVKVYFFVINEWVKGNVSNTEDIDIIKDYMQTSLLYFHSAVSNIFQNFYY